MWRVMTWMGVGLFCLALGSQAQMTTGTISGTVKDSTAAVLPGATVVILNEDTGISRTVQTDSAGRYSAALLSLGQYKVTASLEGFQASVRSGMVLTVGRQAIVNFELTVGAITTTVEVTGEAPLVNTVGGSLGDTIESATISELPLNGRDLAQLITLQAGVVNYSIGDQDGGGKVLVVSGGRATTNVFYMDGIAIESYAQKTPTGRSGNFLGADGVREFKVDTNAYGAEYGRSAGGIFNLATKSGTNTFHGTVFEFLRNDNLDATKWEDNAFGGGKPEFKRNQFGFSLGGPIVRDKTFFFGNYEAYREREGNTQIARTFSDDLRRGLVPILDSQGRVTRVDQVAIDPRIQPYLAFWPRPNSTIHPDGTGDFITSNSIPTDEDYIQARVDHQFSESDMAYVRYTLLDSERSTTSAFPEEGGTVSTTRNQLVTLEEKHIFTPTLLNSLRLGFTRTDPVDSLPVNPRTIDPSLRFVPRFELLGSLSPGSGISGIGRSNANPTRLIVNSYQLADDLIYTKGRNTFKFGLMWIRTNFNGVFPARELGQYNFGSVVDFFRVNVSRFRGTVSACCLDPFRSVKQNIIGLYFQDELRLTPRLTLTPGLRYEFFTVPNEKHGRLGNFHGDFAFMWKAGMNDITLGNPWFENPSLKNFAPRLGVAWDVFGDGRAALRGGFGLFFQQFDQTIMRTTIFRMAPFLIEQEGTANVPFPGIWDLCSQENPTKPTNPACTGRPVTNTVPFQSTAPYVMQYNLNIQRQLASDMIITVGYAGSRGVKLPSVSDVNTPVGVEVNGRLTFPVQRRPNPNFDLMRYRHPMANSWYNALQVSALKRMGKGFQYSLSYTFAKNLDEISGNQTSSDTEVGANESYYHDKSLFKGRSNFDARNVFTFSSTYELPFGPGKPFGSGISGVGEKVFAGWELGGILTLRDGFPAMVQIATRMSRIGIRDEVPDLAPGASNNPSRPGNPTEYYDRSAFVFPPDLTFGNLGRNTLTLPGLATVDFTLTKNTPLTETANLQFRFEAYNLFNRVNFGPPDLEVFDRRGRANSTAGRIESTNTTARQLQFGLKLIF